ncbi:Helix-hairpin-helix motif-containing protein 8 [Phytophthora infestans]|uniref:Helix-hairpin-helix domain n=1 Tax=Phytophthora infestans TaxID=4787 RepID=A0A833SZL4_PHYIN|nr:Helix-hairpin-helix motif-containing protein 8 [Phytophthora infestans]KAF4142309.1 Helix-hairpin-helix domain [Phytophthora infestans]
MKVETTISDLLMECEEQGVQLPESPWQALREVITALRNTKHDALGYLQTTKAFDQLKTKFSKDTEAMETETAAASPRVVRRQKRKLMDDMPKRKRRNMILDSDSDSDDTSVLVADIMSPVASSKKKTKYPKKSRIQEQVEATPAAKDQNQSLVDQLVHLGEYEVTHGYTQRGLARFRAAREIRNSYVVITSGAQAKKLDHVGAAAATKIDQLLNEGLAAALSEYDGDDEALPVTK